MEQRTITIPVLRTPAGDQTCCLQWGDKDQTCPFLRTGRWGLQEVCAFGGGLDRNGNLGYLIPGEGCPIKA